MANYERGVYEPPSDDIRVFDGGEDDIDDEGSRLPLLIVIALLVLAAFAGVVWLAYTQGVQRGRSDAPRIIAAAPGPDKTAPGNSGATPYQGLKIYEQPAPPDDEVADDETAAQQQPAAAPGLRPQQNSDEAMKTVQASAPAATSAPATASSPANVSGPATAPPRALTPPKPAPAATEPVKAAVPAVAAPATPAPVASAPASAGSMMLQIGAYKSADEANAAWKSYEAKHPIAGGYSPDVKQVDLGDKGVWFRLRIGPFDGKTAANAFCDKLKADGAICFPAAP